jgi:hypothetical protein
LEAWYVFLAKRHGLSPLDVWGQYGHPQTALPKAKRAKLWRDQEWRSWLEKVADIRVALKPGGRAASREPEGIATFTVNLQWVLDQGVAPTVVSINITPDWGLAFNEPIDLDAHMMACRIRLARGVPKRARLPQRPKTGEPLNLEFYKALLEEYDGLVRDAHPTPGRELANRRGINYSTLRSYLKRGREYLDKEGN